LLIRSLLGILIYSSTKTINHEKRIVDFRDGIFL